MTDCSLHPNPLEPMHAGVARSALLPAMLLLVAIGCDGDRATEPSLTTQHPLLQADRLSDTVGTFHVNPADPTFVTLPDGNGAGLLQYFGSRTAGGAPHRMAGMRRFHPDNPEAADLLTLDEHGRPALFAGEAGDRLHFEYKPEGVVRMVLALADGTLEEVEFTAPALAHIPASTTDLEPEGTAAGQLAGSGTADAGQLRLALLDRIDRPLTNAHVSGSYSIGNTGWVPLPFAETAIGTYNGSAPG